MIQHAHVRATTFAGLILCLATSCAVVTPRPPDPLPRSKPPGIYPPTAVVAADITRGHAPLEVLLSAKDSLDPDGDIAEFLWDLGDGSPRAAGAEVRHTYVRDGRFDVTLVVKDRTGKSAIAKIAIEVIQETCPRFDNGGMLTQIESPLLEHTTGMVASRRMPGVIWVHDDSKEAARVLAIGGDGRIIGAFDLAGVSARALQDIAIGPGPNPARDYLYLGDIGDPERASNVAPVYRFPEPDVRPGETYSAHTIAEVEVLALAYPDGAAYDAETLLVDPVNGDIFIVTKDPQGLSRVFRAPQPRATAKLIKLELATTLRFPASGRAGGATGGNVSRLGNHVLIRTYERAYLWIRRGGTPLAAAFSRPACEAPLLPEPDGRAIAFTPDGRGYMTLSGGPRQKLYLFSRTR